jgi:hypothetical protein
MPELRWKEKYVLIYIVERDCGVSSMLWRLCSKSCVIVFRSRVLTVAGGAVMDRIG